MLLSFRPLVSVSVLTLLGWCWYSFRRRRRTTAPLWTEEEVCFLDRSRPVNSSPADSSILGESDLKMNYNIPGSSEISNCTDSSPVSDMRNLTCTSPVTSPRLTKGVRPEPEGEVSVRYPETLQAGQEKDSIAGESHPDCREVSEDDSGLESDLVCLSSNCLSNDSHPSTGQQPGSVHMDSHDSSNLSDFSPDRGLSPENMEKISSVLVQQIIEAAAEDWKNQEPIDSHELASVSRPPEGEFQSAAQEPFQQQSISGDDNNSASLQGAVSFREKLSSHLGASVGDDSGCGSCFSEDASGAELYEEGQGFLMTPTEADTGSIESKMIPNNHGVAEAEEEAWRGSGVKSCVSVDTQACSLASLPAQPVILWDIEVPAHLVGRLIGKQGKFMNFLKQSSGAKIYVSTLPFTQEIQICHIQGSQQQVDDALSLIRKKFKDLDLSNCVPLPCLPITSWLLLPQDVFVEVTVSQVDAGLHLFVQQHKHPSYQALPTLTQHMQLCYSQPGCPSLPTPIEVGVVCAAPVTGSGWQRAQVIQCDRESGMAHIRYVDIGGYDTVNSATLRQIRSDFVTLPFQATEVLLDNITLLPGEEEFSLEAKAALEELTANMALIIKVTGSQDGLPLVHMWKQMGDEVVLLNRLLAERGFCTWFETP